MAANQVDFKILPSDQFSVYSPQTRSDKVITYFTLLSKLRGDILSVGQEDDPNNIVSAFYINTGNVQTLHLVKADGSEVTASNSFAGTVTSVDMSVPTGFSISGNPITTSGTLAVGFASGYSLPTDAIQATWTTAYNRSLTAAAVTGTSTKTLTLNQQDGGTITASWSDIDTGLTSVGLTMPAAFSVANSPLTANGTLAVTAAGLSSQYIRGDGQLANFPTPGGGGSSVNYYLNGSVSQGTFGGVTYYELSKTPIAGAGTNFTRTSASGDGYIASFITDANDPDQINIPGGNWNLEFYFNSSSSGGSPAFYGELYKVSVSNVFTLIASGSVNPESITGGTTVDQYYTSIAVPQTALLSTDRLAIRVYVIVSGKNITLHTENSNFSEVITTFSTGLNSLNGLSDQVQYFAVGTSGTDFAISSSLDTHTFNLPTASATNRGALSSADWTTFNSKQGTITLTTTGTTGAATFISNTLNIPSYTDQFVGTVTSVNLTAGTGITVSGGPITTSGSITVNNSDRGSSQNIFKNFAVAGQSTIVADTNDDTLTIVAGSGVTLTTNDTTDTLTISASGSGGTVTSVGTSAPLTGGPITATGTIGITQSGVSTDGYLSSTDWNTFNNKQSTLLFSGPLVNTSGTVSIPVATTSVSGYLNNTDWTTFNSKQNAITLTTTGTTGAATLIGATLNIPNYADQFVGTVTSVNMSVPTGFAISGNPITTSGTLAVAFDTGYSLPTNASQTTWNTAYNDSITAFAYNTSTAVLTLTQQDAGTLTATVTLQPFTTSNLAEGTNLYYTDTRARLALSAGTGITYDSATGVITNSAPDQTVVLTGGTGITTSGTYPSFTVTNSDRGSSQNIFKNIAVAGQSTIVADVNDDTLTVVAGSGVTITTNDTTDTITISATGSGGTVTSVGTTAPITGGTITTTGTIGITQSGAAADGYLSSTDWNTFNNKQNALTNPVTGTGTTNYVSKFTSGTAIGNSQIFDDGTSVGIGTAVPGQKLQVDGNIYVNDNGTTGNGIMLRGADRPLIARGWDPFTSGNKTGVGRWGVYMESSELFIGAPGTDYSNALITLGGWLLNGTREPNLTLNNSTQRVGIGTTAPGAKLDVRGQTYINNGTSNALFIDTTVADNNTRDAIYLFEDDGQASGRQAISWWNGNQSYYKARLWTEVGGGYASTTFGIDVADNSRTVATRLVINNGNVGIGNTAPSQILHVTGNIRVTGAYYDSANAAGTSGQILSSTGTGTSWIAAPSGGVTGSGTTNYVPKWTSASAIGDSAITDNGTTVALVSRALSGTSATFSSSVQSIGLLTTGDNGATTGQFIIESGANASSRRWKLLTSQNVNGDFVIQQSTTQTGSTFADILGFNATGAATFSSTGSFGNATLNGAYLVVKGANGVPASSGTTTTAVFRVSSGTGLYNVLDFGTNESLDYSWIQSTRANSLGTYDYLAIQPNGGNLLVGTLTNSSFKLDVNGTGRFSSHVSATLISANNGDGFRVFASTATAGGSQPGIGYYTVGGSKRFTNQLDVSSDTWGVVGTTGTNYLLIAQTGAATFSSSVTAVNGFFNQQKVGSGVESLDALSLRLFGTNAIGDSLNVKFINVNGTQVASISGLLGPDNIAYGSLAFSTRNYNTDSMIEVMRIDNRARVGIGTTAPQAPLHVIAASSANDALIQEWSYTSTTLDVYSLMLKQTVTSGVVRYNFSMVNNSTAYNDVLVLDRGNVGIGTTTPLQTSANRVVTTINGTTSAILNLGIGGTLASYYFADASGSTLESIGTNTISASGANIIQLTTNGSERMRITSAGNVGIGTTAPVVKTHIVGPTLSTSSETTYPLWLSDTGDTTKALILGFDLVNDVGVIQAVDQAVAWKNISISPSGGNVGIGTTAPSAYLDVKGLSDTAGVISLQLRSGNTSANFNSNQITLGYANTADYRHAIKSRHNSGAGAGNAIDFYIWNNSLNASDIATNPIMSIDTTNVGIGTTAPVTKLQVTSATNAVDVLRIGNTAGDSGSVQGFTHLAINHFNAGTFPSTRITAYQDGVSGWPGGMYFSTREVNTDSAPLERLRITSAGSIGINTTNPTSRLEVVGDARITTGSLGVGVAPNATDGRIDASNDIVAFSTSDRRLKENITPIANALEKVRSLTGVEFDWKEETKSVHGYEGHDVGVIAQDVQAVFPEAVRTNDSGYLSVRYEKMIALLVEANKELADRVEQLEKLIK